MSKVIVLVQARMGSSRFPGKMLALLNDKPIIEWVLRRCAKAQEVSQVVLATSDLARDDSLSDHAEQIGFDVFRGNEEDVLGRFALAAQQYTPEIIVRVCGDRPLVDPNMVDLAIRYYHNHGADLVYNHMSGEGQPWPRGFGVEVFSNQLLQLMHETQTDEHMREHVTPYIWQNQTKYQVSPVPLDMNIKSDIKLDLDTEEDLERLQNISGLNIDSSMHEVLENYLQ